MVSRANGPGVSRPVGAPGKTDAHGIRTDTHQAPSRSPGPDGLAMDDGQTARKEFR